MGNLTSRMSRTMLAAAILVCMAIYVDAHGAMIWPRPRSSHNQTLDAHNKCGAKDPYNKHGQTGPGEYCGAGCIGESCLYYQIGCFHSCATCSYEGKTLWPVENDLVTAGCSTNPPPPTLGGGDPAKAYALRTHNRDLASTQGDWTQWNPWRSPGSTGKGNPGFQPCGVNSGSKPSFPLPPAQGQPAFANGTDLPPLPPSAPILPRFGTLTAPAMGKGSSSTPRPPPRGPTLPILNGVRTRFRCATVISGLTAALLRPRRA